MVGDRAGSGKTEAGAPRKPAQLMRTERCVGGDDDDAASRSGPAARSRLFEQPPDRDPVDPKLAGSTEVRQREHADGRTVDDAARRADPALPPEADHPRAGADGALLDVLTRRGQGATDLIGLDLDSACVVQPAVVAL